MKKLLGYIFTISLIIISFLIINKNMIENNEAKSMSAMPIDFNFSINFGLGYATNHIDTYNNIFTKDFILNGTKTINSKISYKEMKKIYHAFQEYRIYELPNIIGANDISGTAQAFSYRESGPLYTYMTPDYQYFLTYTCNNETKTIICYSKNYLDAFDEIPDEYNRLVNFVNTVCYYIYK